MLALFILLGRSAANAARLRKIFAPLFVELREDLEFLLKLPIFLRGGSLGPGFVRRPFHLHARLVFGHFFKQRILLQFLVHEELQQNPLLEEVAKDEPRVEVEGPSDETGAETPAAKEDREFKEEFEVLSKLDEEWREYFSQASSVRSASAEQDEQRQHFFDSIVEQESLQQHLLQQLAFADVQ